MNKSLLVLLVALCTSPKIWAEDPPIPTVPAVEAKAFLLQDYHSGKVLAEANADVAVEPASLAKILTIYTIASELKRGRIHLDDQVVISAKAAKTGGSKSFVEVGKNVRLEDLVKGAIIQSGNDACVALAEHVGGSEEGFVTLMNHYSQKLGLTNSHWVNSDGLPHPQLRTTARDLSKLSTALIRDFPEIYAWFGVKEWKFNNIVQPNRNRLLLIDQTVDGIKTGHTDSAGYCLIASARRDDMRLISVVLGEKNEAARIKDSQALLNYGFRFYETKQMREAQKPIVQARVWKGAAQEVSLGLTTPFYVTVPRGQTDKITISALTESKLFAPLAKGAGGGKLQAKLGDKVVGEKSLVALQAVEEGGWIRQIIDSLLLRLQ